MRYEIIMCVLSYIIEMCVMEMCILDDLDKVFMIQTLYEDILY